jgi:hypothetical protein
LTSAFGCQPSASFKVTSAFGDRPSAFLDILIFIKTPSKQIVDGR